MEGEILTIIVMTVLVGSLACILTFPAFTGVLLMDALDYWQNWARKFNEGVKRSRDRSADDD